MKNKTQFPRISDGEIARIINCNGRFRFDDASCVFRVLLAYHKHIGITSGANNPAKFWTPIGNLTDKAKNALEELGFTTDRVDEGTHMIFRYPE